MQKPKLNILFAQFCYAGNGGVATVLPDFVPWFAKRNYELKNDERVGQVAIKQYGDIPLDMVRNQVVLDAKNAGMDVIVMLDSDNVPDLYNGHLPHAKPFIETSFNFLYERAIRGIPTVVCAPYCGPPPHPVNGGEENVYVFFATQNSSDDRDLDKVGSIKFEAYSREHAAIMRGIQPCAAGPTGCIMYSTDAFDLMPINELSDDEILQRYSEGTLTLERAKQLLRLDSWFFYEFTNGYRSQKASTEDVTNTREIQFAGLAKHGEPVVFCNWDAWAGHCKPKCVGMPMPLRIEQVSNVYREAIRNNISAQDTMQEIDFTKGPPLPPPPAIEPEAPVSESKIKGMRLGKVFWNPPTSNEDLETLIEYIEAMGAERVVVLGDEAGELSYAATTGNPCSIYRIAEDETDIEGVKRMLSSDPLDVARNHEPQGLDCVILQAAHGGPASVDQLGDWAAAWFAHLRINGWLVILNADKKCLSEINFKLLQHPSKPYLETRHIEGTHLTLIIKVPRPSEFEEPVNVQSVM